MRVEYSSNNSGGSWWLSDNDWHALAAAGWKVDWYKDREDGWASKDGRFCEALASSAEREGLHMAEAVDEWERITGARSTDAGCPCCGQPHTFTEYDDNDKYVTSGPHTSYEASW